MSYALTRLTGDGSTTTFTIGFTYRDKADLVVKVDGVAQAINTDYTIATGGTQITFTSAPANNAAIFFQRATSQNTRLVDYTAGAVFKESDLDTDSIQGFYMSQEAIDIANEAIGKDASNRFDAQGSRIINVADPVDNTDAVNKQFISTNLPNINTVAGIADDVTTVAGISSDVTAVAADASDIGTVSTDIANVNAVATDIANVNAVAADASDIGTVSSNMADVNTVAASIGDVNSYANTYFISATAPSSPTVGDLWFDTTLSVMKVYKGASGGWQNTGADSIVNGTANRYNYVVGTASGSYTGSTTSFPAAYDVGYVDVYLNGVKQVLGTDFTATDGATVVLSTAASTSDAVDIVAYGTFELGPTSTSTESFTGNGTTTSFTLSSDPGGAGSGCVVYIDGVYQERTGYSINGDALEFTEAPPANASIEVLKFTVNSIGSADSTAVTFTQDGTGAVQRSVDSKLNESVSVKDFGAVGDGTTDDTDAIQAAIDSGATCVHIPKGDYLVTSLTVSSITNLTIKSDKARLFNTSVQANGLFRISNSTDITLDNLIIEGTNTTVTLTSGYQNHGIYASSCDGFTVKNCEIKRMTSGGVLVTESVNVRITDNHVHSNNDMFDIAFGYGSTETILQKCWIQNNFCESVNRYGIHIQGVGRDIFVSNNHVKNKYEYGIMVYLLTAGANIWEGVTVSNNTVHNTSHNTITPGLTYKSGMGIYLQSVRYAAVTGNVVKSSLLNRPDTAAPERTLAPAAISLNAVSESTCTGNTVIGSEIDGIDLVNVTSGNDGTTISGNTLIDINWVGVYVQATQNASVTGNSISGRSGGTIYGSGIQVSSHSTQATSQIALSNNAIKNGFNNGIAVNAGTGTSVNGVTITGNEITDISQTYLTCTDTNNLSVSGNVIRNVTLTHPATYYGLQLNNCDNFSVTGNVLAGDATNKLYRGLAVTNSAQGTLTSNSAININDVFYSVYLASNTEVYAYFNHCDRTTGPMLGTHNIGNNHGSDTSYKILYKTSIPVAGDGYFAAGSMCWNLSPSVDGNNMVLSHWRCTASGTPGTWSPQYLSTVSPAT